VAVIVINNNSTLIKILHSNCLNIIPLSPKGELRFNVD